MLESLNEETFCQCQGACSLNCRVTQTALKKPGPDFGAALYNGSNLPAAVSPARKGREVLKSET